jgi:hypothetical protein
MRHHLVIAWLPSYLRIIGRTIKKPKESFFATCLELIRLDGYWEHVETPARVAGPVPLNPWWGMSKPGVRSVAPGVADFISLLEIFPSSETFPPSPAVKRMGNSLRANVLVGPPMETIEAGDPAADSQSLIGIVYHQFAQPVDQFARGRDLQLPAIHRIVQRHDPAVAGHVRQEGLSAAFSG